MIAQRNAYVIRHVAFEDLGSFEEVLVNNNYAIRYFEAGYDNLSSISNENPELLIVLGGPVGVYEHDDYPFLKIEIDILKSRIKKNLPTIGICLGAQLLAFSLGSKVYNGGKKEIGWSKLKLTDTGNQNYFNHFNEKEVAVLHWHGDTFDLPQGAVLQASTDLYQNQAFTYGKNILALQFHPEVIEEKLEKWLIGHTNEISANKLSVSMLRENNRKHAKKLLPHAQAFFQSWLDSLERL